MVDTFNSERDAIRAAIKQQRKALSTSEQQTASLALLSNCLPFLEKATSVAGYQAMSGEISLDPIFNYCHQHNITTLLPIMRGKSLLFAPFNASTTFSTKQYGIQEPDVAESDYLSPEALDHVLVPLVAFDNTCNRIGMGGGFYDRSFEFRKTNAAPPTLIGVAHTLQKVNDVHAQSWDVALDFIATDKDVINSQVIKFPL